MDNSEKLRSLFEQSELTQQEALARFNRGQAKTLAIRTLKSYLAAPDSKTKSNCPDAVLERFQKVMGKNSHVQEKK